MTRRTLLTPIEVAQRLNVSRTTVYALLDDGSLPRVKVRSATRIPEDAVDTFIQEQLDGGHRHAPQSSR